MFTHATACRNVQVLLWGTDTSQRDKVQALALAWYSSTLSVLKCTYPDTTMCCDSIVLNTIGLFMNKTRAPLNLTPWEHSSWGKLRSIQHFLTEMLLNTSSASNTYILKGKTCIHWLSITLVWYKNRGRACHKIQNHIAYSTHCGGCNTRPFHHSALSSISSQIIKHVRCPYIINETNVSFPSYDLWMVPYSFKISMSFSAGNSLDDGGLFELTNDEDTFASAFHWRQFQHFIETGRER